MKEKYDYKSDKFLADDQVKFLNNLNNTYKLIDNCIENLDYNLQSINNLENKIYTVNGKTMSDKEKIMFELKNVEDIINKKKLSEFYQFQQRLHDINLLLSADMDDDSILYIKKQISCIQALLDMPNYFLYATYLAYIESSRNLKIRSNKIKRYKKDW